MSCSSSTDLIDACKKASLPFKVIFDNTVYLSAKSFSPWPSGPCIPIKKEQEPIDDRFEILDIRSESNHGLTVVEVWKYFEKIKDDINNPTIWKYEEERKPFVSGDHLAEMLERDIKETLKRSMEEFVEGQWIEDRFEILDL